MDQHVAHIHAVAVVVQTVVQRSQLLPPFVRVIVKPVAPVQQMLALGRRHAGDLVPSLVERIGNGQAGHFGRVNLAVESVVRPAQLSQKLDRTRLLVHSQVFQDRQILEQLAVRIGPDRPAAGKADRQGHDDR